MSGVSERPPPGPGEGVQDAGQQPTTEMGKDTSAIHFAGSDHTIKSMHPEGGKKSPPSATGEKHSSFIASSIESRASDPIQASGTALAGKPSKTKEPSTTLTLTDKPPSEARIGDVKTVWKKSELSPDRAQTETVFDEETLEEEESAAPSIKEEIKAELEAVESIEVPALSAEGQEEEANPLFPEMVAKTDDFASDFMSMFDMGDILVEEQAAAEDLQAIGEQQEAAAEQKETLAGQKAVAGERAETVGEQKGARATDEINRLINILQSVYVKLNADKGAPTVPLSSLSPEVQRTVRAHDFRVPRGDVMFVHPAAGLRKGEKIQERDENGKLKEYTVDHLSEDEVKMFTKALERYIVLRQLEASEKKKEEDKKTEEKKEPGDLLHKYKDRISLPESGKDKSRLSEEEASALLSTLLLANAQEESTDAKILRADESTREQKRTKKNETESIASQEEWRRTDEKRQDLRLENLKKHDLRTILRAEFEPYSKHSKVRDGQAP